MHWKIDRKARLTADSWAYIPPGSDSSLVPAISCFFVLPLRFPGTNTRKGDAGARVIKVNRRCFSPFLLGLIYTLRCGGVSLRLYILDQCSSGTETLGFQGCLHCMTSTSVPEEIWTAYLERCPPAIYPHRFSMRHVTNDDNSSRMDDEKKGREGWSKKKPIEGKISHPQYGPAFAQEGFAAIKAAASSPVRLLPLRNRGVSIPEGGSKIPSTWWSV